MLKTYIETVSVTKDKPDVGDLAFNFKATNGQLPEVLIQNETWEYFLPLGDFDFCNPLYVTEQMKFVEIKQCQTVPWSRLVNEELVIINYPQINICLDYITGDIRTCSGKCKNWISVLKDKSNQSNGNLLRDFLMQSWEGIF